MAIGQCTDILCELTSWNGNLDSDLRSAWEQLIAADSFASVFHYPEWIEIACQERVISPTYLLTVRQENRIIALIPRKKSLIPD